MKELKRVLIFLLLIAFYFTTKIGFTIGVMHLILYILKPKVFGMSKLIHRILNAKRIFQVSH